jgi:hypothetical protein
MNGYELTERLRKVRRKHPLTATEQALYHELVAICNISDWEAVFSCSNHELCSALQITEKTLIKARMALISAGLINHVSGKSRRCLGNYSFNKKKLTTGNNTVDEVTAGNIPVESIVVEDMLTTGNNTAENAITTVTSTGIFPDYIKPKQTKHKYRENINLTIEEHERLVKEFGEAFANACYDYLSDYKIEKNYKSKDDNRTIRRWVVDAVGKQGKVVVLSQVRSTGTNGRSYDPTHPDNQW